MITSGIDWTASTYEEVVRRHRWTIPDTLNIAHIACDRHATTTSNAQTSPIALIAINDRNANGQRRVTTYSFDDLKSLSDRAATVLADLGVERGDRVAVFLPQRVECAVAHLAAFKLGAVSVPLSPLFREEALAYRLRHSGSKVVVTDAEHLPHLPRAEHTGARILSCDDGDESSRVEPFWKRVEEAKPTTPVITRADDPAMIVYTSGTSGLPKGAVHAHRFLPGRLSGFELLHRLEARARDDEATPSTSTSTSTARRAFWTPADWAWVGGLVDCVLTPWVFGCPILGWRRSGPFDPIAVVEFLREMEPSSLFLPPTAINRMRSVIPDPPRLAFIESVHTAGEPLSPETYAWAVRMFGEVVHELYGMTEMGATIGNTPFFPVRPGSMGKPLAGHEVTLLREESTEEVPLIPTPIPTDADANPEAGSGMSDIGEIAIRRGDPGMFLGYLDDEAATNARFRGEWLVTGDLAARDRDGYLYYRGRADDVFNTAGYRVGPTEIEQCLASHPAVEHAAVVGAPDAERGEVVKAFIVVREGHEPNAALASAIQAHVKTRLAAYEYPRRIVFARELPITPSGKIRRVELRAADADERYGLPAARDPDRT